MKRFLAVITAAAMCMLATGCLQQARQLPLEDVIPAITPPPSEQTAQGTDDQAPKTDDPEVTQPDISLNCGQWTVTLPGQYAHLLLTTATTEITHGRQALLAVYEAASVEAARKDLGDSRGMGFLFGITMLEGQAYQEWLREDFPGYTLFARDEAGHYFFRVEPTDVRFYRSDYTTADSSDWNTLSALAVPTCEQFITANGLISCTRISNSSPTSG